MYVFNQLEINKLLLLLLLLLYKHFTELKQKRIIVNKKGNSLNRIKINDSYYKPEENCLRSIENRIIK